MQKYNDYFILNLNGLRKELPILRFLKMSKRKFTWRVIPPSKQMFSPLMKPTLSEQRL